MNAAEQSSIALAATSAQARLLPALAAAILGVIVLLGVGFAHSDTIHNAAHDTRHSAAFPCH